MFFTVSIPYSSGGNSNRKKMKEEKNKMILFQSLIHQGEKSTVEHSHRFRAAI